jgi:hypothetical protein
VRLPDHLDTPGPWLAGAGGHVGPLVALVGGERRGWLRSGNGLAGCPPAPGSSGSSTCPVVPPTQEPRLWRCRPTDGGWDLTERETADLLGISVGTVTSQARDALVRLRWLMAVQPHL